MRTMMIRAAAACTLAGVLTLPTASLADPIHRIDGDAYWHHDSGWIFPARLNEFEREGAAQDVAGSRDAVAHYVRNMHGVRVVVAVDVFPADSAAGQTTFELARAALLSEVNGTLGKITDEVLPVSAQAPGTRVQFIPAGDAATQVLYFVSAGEWRVRIRATIPMAAREVNEELDDFVRAQHWDTLAPG